MADHTDMAKHQDAKPEQTSKETPKADQPPVWLHLVVGATLLILLAATAGAAFLPLGRLSTPVAVSIALAKAVLILLYFMNLRFGDRRLWLVAAAGFVWLSILFTLSLSDYLTRGYLHIPGK